MHMTKRGFEIMRQLIADVEGAPYPNSIDSELYTIWYEHVQAIAQEALEFINQNDKDLNLSVDIAASDI